MVGQPIFIVGVPRSGTSLVTGILAACGAFTGETYGPSPWNPKGNFENRVLKDQMVKPWLEMVGADPLGLDPLPSADRASEVIIPANTWQDMATRRLKLQGWTGGAWAFKECKLVLQWHQWHAAFPNAQWVHIRRDKSEIVKSCLRAEPMLKRKGPDWAVWLDWVERYEAMLAAAPKHHEIWTQRDVLDDRAGIKKLVETLGLTWRPDVVGKFIDMDVWGGGL